MWWRFDRPGRPDREDPDAAALRDAAGRGRGALGRALRALRRRHGAVAARAVLRRAFAGGRPPALRPVRVLLVTAYEPAVLDDALSVAGAILGLDLHVTAYRGIAAARTALAAGDLPADLDAVAVSLPATPGRADDAAGGRSSADALAAALAADLAADTRAPVLSLAFGPDARPAAVPDPDAPDVTRLSLAAPNGGVSPFDTRFAGGIGTIPTSAAADALADALAAFAARRAGLAPKLVVTDLDDTLWRGALGEGEPAPGPAGTLPAVDRAYAAALETLRGRGLVLAAASRNALRDVDDALDRLTADGTLPPGFFAARAAGWRDKDALVAEVLETVGLAAEHAVFLDDDPLNCARTAARFPEMEVRWTGGDGARAADDLLADPRFALAATDPAADPAGGAPRAERYRLRAEVDRLRAASIDHAAFLAALDTRVRTRPIAAATAGRAAELARRVNQVVLVDDRPTRAALAERNGPFDFLVEVSDVFGDHGLVGLVLADPDDAGTVRLRNLFLSCRVLQRGIETAMLHALARRAAGRGFRALVGRIEALARNHPARGCLAAAGFVPDGDGWRLALAGHRGAGPGPTLPPGVTLIDDQPDP